MIGSAFTLTQNEIDNNEILKNHREKNPDAPKESDEIKLVIRWNLAILIRKL